MLNTAAAGYLKMKDCRVTLLGTGSPAHIYSVLEDDCPVGIQIINQELPALLTESRQMFILNHKQKYHCSKTLIISNTCFSQESNITVTPRGRGLRGLALREVIHTFLVALMIFGANCNFHLGFL